RRTFREEAKPCVKDIDADAVRKPDTDRSVSPATSVYTDGEARSAPVPTVSCAPDRVSMTQILLRSGAMAPPAQSRVSRYHHWVTRHPVKILVGVLLVGAVASFLASRLGLKTSFEELLPSNDPG